jgi:hypothetical protein
MKARSLRAMGPLLAVAALMLVVFAPAALAQTDYPTTPTTPTKIDPCKVHPCGQPSTSGQAVSTRTSGTSLPFTGGNIALLVGVGLAAAFGGVVLVRVGRRADATG